MLSCYYKLNSQSYIRWWFSPTHNSCFYNMKVNCFNFLGEKKRYRTLSNKGKHLANPGSIFFSNIYPLVFWAFTITIRLIPSRNAIWTLSTPLNLIRSIIKKTTPQTFQIKRIQLCVRPRCVTLFLLLGEQTAAATTEEEVERCPGLWWRCRYL